MRLLLICTAYFFAACEQPLIKVQSGIANLPQLPPAESCLNTLKSQRLGSIYMGTEADILEGTSHTLSWRDTAFLSNKVVTNETYYGTFQSSSHAGSCAWQGSLDSFRLYFGDYHQTFLIPDGAVNLEQNQSPRIRAFGNDTTIIQGFKITFDGFSGATGNMVYQYYLFNGTTKRFTRDTLLSNLSSSHVDLEQGTVTSGWNGGNVGRIGGRSMYKLTSAGQLEFLKNWHSEPEGDGYRVTRTEMKNGQRVTWSEVATRDEWETSVWY